MIRMILNTFSLLIKPSSHVKKLSQGRRKTTKMMMIYLNQFCVLFLQDIWTTFYLLRFVIEVLEGRKKCNLHLQSCNDSFGLTELYVSVWRMSALRVLECMLCLKTKYRKIFTRYFNWIFFVFFMIETRTFVYSHVS